MRKVVVTEFITLDGVMEAPEKWSFPFWNDVDIRCYDQAAIVRNVQRNKAIYDGKHLELTVRVSQVWVNQQGQWRLAGIQFSPMAGT